MLELTYHLESANSNTGWMVIDIFQLVLDIEIIMTCSFGCFEFEERERVEFLLFLIGN
jgi:hypothetical protein